MFSLIGTKALLRTSSAVTSLSDSLGLLGGVLDGLFGIVEAVVVVVVEIVDIVFPCNVVYSVGYFM